MTTIFRKTTRPISCFILVAVFMSQGCIPFISWIKDDDAERSRSYQLPIQVVWEAVPIMIKELGLVMVDENKKKRYFLAENKMSALSHGERVVITLEKVDATNTNVKIQSKRLWASDAVATNWGVPMLDKLDEMLGQHRPDSSAEKKES